jgi:cell shape-determining protein MreC
MRNRKSAIPLIQIFALLLALMSVPIESSLMIKGVAIASLAPIWGKMQNAKQTFQHVNDTKITSEDGSVSYAKEEIDRLKLENQLLANEIQNLIDILKNEAIIASQAKEIESLAPPDQIDYLKRLRKEDFTLLLTQQLQSIPAQVIFRSPSSWTNSFWINAGSSNNDSLGRIVIAKNSPVVIGTSVAGVIDYVGNHQSRVRMITDSGLSPSVRVMRVADNQTWYLAKGELRGSVDAAWRGLSPALKGVGFNYDYADEAGPSRDLRSGEALGTNEKLPKMPIIQIGDLLVTTGMDGVFPRGLQVAKVSKINLLKEGDYCYEIEAVACVKNLDDLTTVYILPPTAYDPNIQAPLVLTR